MFLRWIAAAFGCISCIAQASAACKINQLAEFHVVPHQDRPYVEGKINGQPVTAELNTSSPFTFISGALATQLKLKMEGVANRSIFGSGGEQRLQATWVSDIELGAFSSKNIKIFVVSTMRDENKDHRQLTLGYDFLSQFTTEWDLANGVVRFLKPEGCQPEQLVYWAKGFSVAELNLGRTDNERIQTAISLSGTKIWAELDSSATTSWATPDVARRTGATRLAGAESDSATLSSGLNMETWIGVFGSVSIGDDETVSNVKLRVGDVYGLEKDTHTGSRIAHDIDRFPGVILGNDFLHAHRLIVATSSRKLLFTYNGGPIFQTRLRNSSLVSAQ